jgi:predicted small integral membrane protein
VWRLVRIGGDLLQNSQGYLLSGVTATLADQLGAAVFYASGIGSSGVSLEINLSFVDTATVGVRPISLSRPSTYEGVQTSFLFVINRFLLEIFVIKLRSS